MFLQIFASHQMIAMKMQNVYMILLTKDIYANARSIMKVMAMKIVVLVQVFQIRMYALILSYKYCYFPLLI